LGLLVAALGEGMPPLSIDLIETLLIYNWPGDLVELMEVAMELRVRGAGLDALVTELVSPRLRGRRTASVFSDDSHTQIDVRRPIPSRPDLEGLLTIHDGNVDAVADVLGRSRMQVTAWIQQFDLDPDEG
jgi:transcriptional regulator of acetoin/glycerol metabolism